MIFIFCVILGLPIIAVLGFIFTLIGYSTYKLGFDHFVCPEEDGTIKKFDYMMQGTVVTLLTVMALEISGFFGIAFLHLIGAK